MIEKAPLSLSPWTQVVNFISKGTIFCSYAPAKTLVDYQLQCPPLIESSPVKSVFFWNRFKGMYISFWKFRRVSSVGIVLKGCTSLFWKFRRVSSFGIVSKGCTSLFGSLEACLLLESFQRDAHLFLEVWKSVFFWNRFKVMYISFWKFRRMSSFGIVSK